MADAIVIENHENVYVIEDSTPPPNTVESVEGTSTVVEVDAPTSIEIENVVRETTAIEVAAQTAIGIETTTNNVFEIESTTGPTGRVPVMYYGAAPPPPGTGLLGDMYIVNTGPNIGDLYTKEFNGWGTPKSNLVGGVATVNGETGPHVIISANDITTGEFSAAMLPYQLRNGRKDAVLNLNTQALENGFYGFGPGSTNTPEGAAASTGWWFGVTETLDPNPANLYVTQTVRNIGNSVDNTQTWRRACYAGVWQAWYKIMDSQLEMDIRYAQKVWTQTGVSVYKDIIEHANNSPNVGPYIVVTTKIPFDAQMVTINLSLGTLHNGATEGDFNCYMYTIDGGTVYMPKWSGRGVLPIRVTGAKNASNNLVLILEPVENTGVVFEYTRLSINSVQINNGEPLPAHYRDWTITYPADLTGLTTFTTEQHDLGTLVRAKAERHNATFTGTTTGITKAMVGLGNVDNTSDLNKPISTATQVELNTKATLAAQQTFTGVNTFNNVTVFDGPGTIKLKAGTADHTYMEFYARTATPNTRSAYFGPSQTNNNMLLVNEMAGGPIILVPGAGGTISLSGPAQADAFTTGTLKVGTATTAGYVLTADSSGNATWQQTANIIVPSDTTKYYRGDLTWQTLNSTVVGLGNVNNTSDAAKPVSTAQQTALDLKANITNPTFSGQVTIASAGNNGLEIGRVDSNASTPFIDFHSSASNNDFDVRLIANGGGSGNSTGTLTLQAATFVISAVTSAGIIGATQVQTSGPASLQMKPAAADHTYMEFYARTSSPSNRSGWFGYPTPAGNTMQLTNDIGKITIYSAGSDVELVSPNGSVVLNTPNGSTYVNGTLHAGTLFRVGGSATLGHVLTADASGFATWQAMTPARAGLGNVANSAQVDLASGQTVTGAKTFNNASNVFTGNGAALTALNATQLTTGVAPQARIVPNIQRFISTTGSEARPTGTTYVEWIGPIQPANSSNDDTWTDTSIGTIEDPTVSMPVGIIHMYGGSGAPTNWMKCDGTAINRSTYSVLFGIIGTTYGAGDNATTFNLPNFADRVPVGNSGTIGIGSVGGAKTHTLTVNEMPSHTHSQNPHAHVTGLDAGTNGYTGGIAGGVFFCNTPPSHPGYFGMASSYETATNNYTGGGAAHNIMQPYLGVNFIIKVL